MSLGCLRQARSMTRLCHPLKKKVTFFETVKQLKFLQKQEMEGTVRCKGRLTDSNRSGPLHILSGEFAAALRCCCS